MSNSASSTEEVAVASDTAPRLCGPDNWSHVLDDPAPRAVRWAVRELARTMQPDWSAWHYTEGNGFFTACGASVVPFAVDGSPEERDVAKVTCRRCRSRIGASQRANAVSRQENHDDNN